MKIRCTALLLSAIMCMAGAVSCGKVDNVGESSAALTIKTTAASTDDVTTSTETGTTTTDKDGTTETTTGTDTTAEGAAETTAAQADAQTEAPADNGAANNNNNNAGEQPQEQQQNNETPAAQNEPEKKEVKFGFENLLQNAADTIAALGNPNSTETAAACTNNDVKIYHYPDLDIQCYIDGGAEYIWDYDFKGGDYTTSKGIKVGSSRADVEAAYGTGEESGNTLIYTDGDKQLIFTMNGDTVSEIDFYVPV